MLALGGRVPRFILDRVPATVRVAAGAQCGSPPQCVLPLGHSAGRGHSACLLPLEAL